MNNYVQGEQNPNYNYINQNSGEQNFQYAQQMSGEQNDNNNQNSEEKLPPIYETKIASVKETSEHQVKYFEPIELSEEEDVTSFLSSGKLMKQIAPKIMQLKQETQKEGMSNDPLVHTEINFDLKQNTAIYDGPEQNNENNNQEEEEQSPKNNKKKTNNNPGEIKYSSVLPPKYAELKVINIDQYGNRKVEENDDDDINIQDNQDDDLNKQSMLTQSQMNLKQEQLREQEQQQLLLQKQLQEEQIQLQKQIQQEQIQLQKQIEQQKLQEEQIKRQQLIQQQRIQFQQQQQNLTDNKRPSVPMQSNHPFMRAYSDNNGSINNFNLNMTNRIPMNIKTVKINDQYKTNTINVKQKIKKDPIVQKAIKIYGTLRQRVQQQPTSSIPTISSISSNNEILAARIIQSKWRNYFMRKKFIQIMPQLKMESQAFLKQQYDICDKAGPIASDADFDPEGWKRFYSISDPFFNFNKGFVIQSGIKIKHPNNPERLTVYEGDINMKNERHGFGRLTTIKSVFLGEWRNGVFTGWGRETRRSGKVYEGKFINGLIQGKGILKNNKGVTYVGDFMNSKRHGKGILDTHKVHYEGDFKNDKLSGKGRITFKIEGHVYEGDFDNNEINGFGTFKWKNGDSYTGYMLNGKMHGNGKYYYNNGLVYEGRYNNGIKEGKGKVYNTKGMTMSEVQSNINNQNNNSKKMNLSGVSNISKFSGNK